MSDKNIKSILPLTLLVIVVFMLSAMLSSCSDEAVSSESNVDVVHDVRIQTAKHVSAPISERMSQSQIWEEIDYTIDKLDSRLARVEQYLK